MYVIFVGIILSLTVGFGIAAFYPEPKSPYYPVEKYVQVPPSCYDKTTNTTSQDCERLIKEQKDAQARFEAERVKRQEEELTYRNKSGGYTRTAIFLGVSIGALLAIGGLLIINKSRLVANGLLLSGVLTAVLTRLLISLASLGSYAGGTESANAIAYGEFGILVFLSLGVIYVGFSTLRNT